ncbi:MAG TPA: GNAT family N-acetyltransferase [Acidimicrobiia bacterium]|nr:GNAT family N-acetyltransferase [Acidimicrobiia bacterium]
MSRIEVRVMDPEDWPEVARIYGEGIATGNATFETTAPGWETWDRNHSDDCRLVAVLDDAIAGWAALSPVSGRYVYRGVAEVSVYVSSSARGRGIGSALLGALAVASEEAGYWTLQTSIFPENAASISLHEKHGFRIVGTRERIGQHNGTWRDTVFMERRSAR